MLERSLGIATSMVPPWCLGAGSDTDCVGRDAAVLDDTNGPRTQCQRPLIAMRK